MRTLILSCNTGQGHNSCAKAIKEYYDAKQEVCTICDALGFISEFTSNFISNWHVRIYRYLPGAFRVGYRFAEDHSSTFREDSALYKLIALGAERLSRYIRAGAYDSIICTHVFTALMLTAAMRKYELDVASCLVATDYTCSPSGKDGALDRYFIPDISLADDFVCPNIPRSKIVGSGIPVRQMFYTHIGKEEAKRQFSVAPAHKHLVMACGSMGCGPIEKLTKSFSEWLRPDQELTVVCGSNEKLQRRLEREYVGLSHLHIRGYVQNMSALLDSADLYLTKPGGISVSEAAQKMLPMVLVDAAAGCEEYNKQFFLDRGGAKTADTVEDLTALCISLLSDEAQLQQMADEMSRMDRGNAAEMIYDYMKSREAVPV